MANWTWRSTWSNHKGLYKNIRNTLYPS
jgi:hypothetical protein